jgi:hypothetical protein
MMNQNVKSNRERESSDEKSNHRFSGHPFVREFYSVRLQDLARAGLDGSVSSRQ